MGFWDDAEVISTYSRAQAIEDGVLVDVSVDAKEAGISFPVAVTRAVWEGCVAVPEGLEGYGQSEAGRLWDVVWMLRCAIRYQSNDQDDPSTIRYRLGVQQEAGQPPRTVELKAICGPGDDPAPVITIMYPEED